GNAERRKYRLALHGEGRSLFRRDFVVEKWLVHRLVVFGLKQRYQMHDGHRVDVDYVMRLVEGEAAPVVAAAGERIEDRGERRLRRQIIVPNIMMRGLEGPGDFAVLHVQSDDRIGVVAIARAQPTEEVGTCAGHRQNY